VVRIEDVEMAIHRSTSAVNICNDVSLHFQSTSVINAVMLTYCIYSSNWLYFGIFAQSSMYVQYAIAYQISCMYFLYGKLKWYHEPQ